MVRQAGADQVMVTSTCSVCKGRINENERLKEAIDPAHAVYDNLLSDYQILKRSKND